MHSTVNSPPNSVSSLEAYRNEINLNSPFLLPAWSNATSREQILQAIHLVWDSRSQNSLAIHLEAFLKYIAKTEHELFNLLQLSTSACSVVSLTESALLATDVAYGSIRRHRHADGSPPDTIFELPKGGRLEIFRDFHRTSDVEASVCLTDEAFLPAVRDYRSFRIHAEAGPRMRRDCELATAKLVRLPWAIITRGYFSPFRYIVHSRTPYVDSEVAFRQRLNLREAYISALELAAGMGIESIEVPLISIPGSRSTVDKIRRTIVEAIHAAQNSTPGFKRVCLIGYSSS
ncbi:MAG: macro domain-containing protein [Nitrospira sp.]|nr:macro domain-containing protein [Nitrospira sp.]MBX3513112.1 macro domain-containing protein [Xanthobacteraceae bacterium]